MKRFFLSFLNLFASWRELLQFSARLKNADYSRRFPVDSKDPVSRLGEAFNTLADRVSARDEALIKEKGEREAVLDGMVEGVLVVDPDGIITLANPAIRSILDLDEACIGQTVLEAIRNRVIHQSIEEAREKKISQKREVLLEVSGEPLTLQVNTKPLSWGGARPATVTVVYDISEIKKLETSRRDFVANVSHELKTPLTSVLGYAETLKEGALEDPTVARSFIDKIDRNAKLLKNLVDDLLSLSEIESGKTTLSLSPRSLHPILKSLLPECASQADLRKMTIENKVPSDIVVRADERALIQVFSNLIQNAIKYGKEGGRIVVTANPEGDKIRISVEDNGGGIEPKDLPRLFERFYRADKVRTKSTGGTGLGLSIVKHLVDGMGGEVGVESELEKGSRFWFTLAVG